MYEVRFYRDRNGREPVWEYLRELSERGDKDSRIKAAKIREYVRILSLYGTQVGEPYVKHLDGEIWELRPARDRILFAAWEGNVYVLLHVFTKRTKKTPKHEMERAKKNLKEYRGRSGDGHGQSG